MGKRNARDLLEFQWSRGNFLCIGLDSDLDHIPTHAFKTDHTRKYFGVENTLFEFNRRVIMETHGIAATYKINPWFYLLHGTPGMSALERTVTEIKTKLPDIPIIIDVKAGDVSHTNVQIARFVFEHLDADALTVHAYPGQDALEPFLSCGDKLIFVICRMSNANGTEFQNLPVSIEFDELMRLCGAGATPYSTAFREWDTSLSNHVAYRVATHWNKRRNCGIVVGATHTSELQMIRNIAPDVPILAPGIKTQGGSIHDAYHAGKDARGGGILLAASRSILFPQGKSHREAAQALHDGIIAETS